MRKISKSVLALTASILLATQAQAEGLNQAISADLPSLMEIYRDLHANPELSGEEYRTAAKLAAEARRLGFEVTEKVGGTGVVAVMKNGEGPTVMLRADMDGLPLIEKTGLPYASKVMAKTREGADTGVMHACGHDTHMTGWVGAARQLAARKEEWSGTLVMILQPAEETGEGAKAMLEDGLYTRFPKPEYVLAFHDAAGAPAGHIGYAAGYALANVDSVDIQVNGVGGHGAYPHTTKDPIVLASRIVGALQTLVSREIDPQDPAVVTVGSFNSGFKHNIISDKANLQLTVRSYSDETRAKLLDGIKRIVRGEAIAAGVPEDRMPVVGIREDEYTPATYNSPEFSKEMGELFAGRFGKDRVHQTKPVMGGEDFSRYRRADTSIKSMIFWVGGVPMEEYLEAQKTGAKLPSLHSPLWAPDAEKVVATGAEALAAAALDLMKKTN
ncbi:hippurate hydrolase [Parasphingorhabdus marina DSM 22363]|uniref:Hippurate hydrolase n=1 Tax=Parasphingorhabdus marina DSM 22363 TaxID=1123272 RepID=A0A1N6EVS3_9SPHN|nr:amidohydrolase [Parasphingorhabdus marina]SIN87043.1 hippurate hydrolase [Parasphingorhabdus marina DSM 22363]